MQHASPSTRALTLPSPSAVSHGRPRFTAAVLLILAASLLLGAAGTSAQTVQHTENKADLALKSGLRVDPSTLGMGISIPLASYPGRAGAGMPVAVNYSSKVLRLDYRNTDSSRISGLKTWTQVEFAEHSTAGWTSSLAPPRVEFTGMGQYYDYQGRGACDTCVPEDFGGDPDLVGNHYVKRIHVHMPDGSTHELRADDQVRIIPLEAFTGTFLAVDGTLMRFESNADSASVLYLPDGSRYLFPAYNGGADLTAAQFVDRHGNALTYNAAARQWTDTLGRAITDPLPQNPAADTETYFYAKLVGGGDATYTFRWKHLGDVLTHDPGTSPPELMYPGDYKCSPNNYPQVSPSLFTSDFGTRVCVERDPNNDNPILFNPVVLAEVELPTGNKYVFTYDVYGEIDHVQLPTGGAESFTYAQVPTLSYSTPTYAQTNRGVARRKADPGGGAAVLEWNYAVTSASPYTVRVTAHDGSYSERLLYKGLNTTSSDDFVKFGFDDARAGMAYEERSFDPAGVMLRRTLSKWEAAGPTPGAPYGSRDPKVTKAVSILLDGGGPNALWSATINRYEQADEPLNLTSATVYGYDASMGKSASESSGVDSFVPADALAVRTTETAYLDLEEYRGRGLTALPTSVVVRAGLPGGAVVSQSQILYDETARSPLPCGAAAGWANPGTAALGDATTSRQWLDTTGGWVEEHAQFDQCGSLRQTWDALGHVSKVFYDDLFSDGQNGRGTYAFPTRTESPAPDPSGQYGSAAALVTSTVYDFSTGAVTSTTDANNQTTTFGFGGDPLNRLKAVVRPDGGRTDLEYSNAVGNLYVRTLTDLDATRRTEAKQFFDGLGRAYRSARYEGSDAAKPWITVDTEYDTLGRVKRVSMPYRAAEGAAPFSTDKWAESAYDALGRVLSVTTEPDGAVVSTGYSGDRVLTTDQAGRQRISKADALGRLREVWEVTPNDPAKYPGIESIPSTITSGLLDSAYGYGTEYFYDASGNLRRVKQGSQQRFFAYDSLNRLLRARNPEQGSFTPDAAGGDFPALTDSTSGVSNDQWSTGYLYDANSNLTKRKDARNVTATYGYDGLNRNTAVDYSDATPDVTRIYDGAILGKGRVWKSESFHGTLTVVDEYDVAGRPRQQTQKFWTGTTWEQAQAYGTSLEYNLAGGVTKVNYPSGHSVGYQYDAAGRLGDNGAEPAFKGTLGDSVERTYASQVTYSESGGLREERFGTTTPLYHKLHYNRRGQLYDIRLSTQSLGANEWDWDRGAIVNYYSGNYAWEGNPATPASADNNGNLRRQQTWVPAADQMSSPTFTQQTYDYDALNRLSWVTEAAGTNGTVGPDTFRHAYDYDRWGNRTINAAGTWLGQQTAPPSDLINEKQFSVDAATNRLGVPAGQAGRMDYDAAGNLINDSYSPGSSGSTAGVQTRFYDAENRMVSAADNSGGTTFYTYDGDGRRVRRLVGSAGEVWQVYGLGGELLAEYAAGAPANQPRKEYGYRGGELLVTCEPASAGWGPAPTFTGPDPLAKNDPILLEHLTDLRSAVNQLRQHAGLAPYNFNVDPNPERKVTTVKADHIRKLRTALEEARSHLGLSTGGYEHPALTNNVSLIYAKDFQELREQVRGAWQTGTSGTDIRWLVSDQLGTPRMVADKTGSLAGVARHDYLPFGKELYAGTGGRTPEQGYKGNVDGNRKRWAQLERDDETGLDYAQNRYYSSIIGRSTSPDQALADQWEDDPQSWNLYVYAGNNPLMFIDPTGLWKQVDCSSGKCWEAEKGDTLYGLAKILNVDGHALSQFFGGGKIDVGQIFDASGYYSSLSPVTAYAHYDSDTPREMLRVYYDWRRNRLSSVWVDYEDFKNTCEQSGRPCVLAGTIELMGMRSLPNLLGTARMNLLNTAQHPKLRRLIEKLYSDTGTVGNGSTADAIRHELETGELLSKKGHIQAGREGLRGLKKIVGDPTLTDAERGIVRQMIDDLTDALK